MSFFTNKVYQFNYITHTKQTVIKSIQARLETYETKLSPPSDAERRYPTHQSYQKLVQRYPLCTAVARHFQVNPSTHTLARKLARLTRWSMVATLS